MDLYYYTTSETMRYILTGGNIFATNMKYMNDSEEYTNGLREIRKLLLDRKAEPDLKILGEAAEKLLSEEKYKNCLLEEVNSFSISFTTACDRLSQWTTYARESGVSLKLNFKNKPYTFLVSDNSGDIRENYSLRPRKVYYFTKETMSDSKYRRVGNFILEDINKEIRRKKIQDINDGIIKIWQGMAPFVKRADFNAEEEYRLVFSFENTLYFTPKVSFRNDKHVLKPYLDISLKEGWPIAEIIVGPGFDQDAVFDSIRYFLKHGEIKVPELSAADFFAQTLDYLDNIKAVGLNETDRQEIKKEWKSTYDNYIERSEEKQNELLYRIFIDFWDKIQTTCPALQQCEYTKNYYLSPAGIILKKSSIPYIY